VRSNTRHRQLACQVGAVSLVKANSIAIIFKNKIALNPGAMFRFGTISCIADKEGTMHHVEDTPEKRPTSEILREAGASPQATPLLAAQGKMAPRKPGLKSPRRMEGQSVGASPTRRTPLSTSPTKEWTRITRKKEMNVQCRGRKTQRAIFPAPPPSKEDGKQHTSILAPFYPDILFTQGRLESLPVSDDEPTSVMPDDGETDAEMCGGITKPRNRTRRNPYLGTKLRKWEKLLMNEYTEKEATLAAVIADKLKNGNGN
jgi:hypothetical protein